LLREELSIKCHLNNVLEVVALSTRQPSRVRDGVLGDYVPVPYIKASSYGVPDGEAGAETQGVNPLYLTYVICISRASQSAGKSLLQGALCSRR
jgi:hypothetical protein